MKVAKMSALQCIAAANCDNEPAGVRTIPLHCQLAAADGAERSPAGLVRRALRVERWAIGSFSRYHKEMFQNLPRKLRLGISPQLKKLPTPTVYSIEDGQNPIGQFERRMKFNNSRNNKRSGRKPLASRQVSTATSQQLIANFPGALSFETRPSWWVITLQFPILRAGREAWH
jgi:hypothetical protein